MSFANTVLRQRERESKALRTFLACSLAGSLIFHLALLASGITKYLLNREPSIEDEPVEITLLDTPIEEIEPEAKEEIKPEPKPEVKQPEVKQPEIKQPVIDTSKIQPNLDTTPSESRISGGSPALSNSQPIPTQPRIAPPPVQQPFPLPKIEQPNFKPIQPLEEPISPVLPSTPPVVTKPKPIIPEPVIPEPKPEPEPEPIVKNDIPKPIPQPEPEPPKPIEEPSQELKDLLAQQRDARTPRDLVNPPPAPIEPPTQPDEDLKDLLAQERNSRRTARSLPNPAPAPIEPPATTPQESGELRDTLSGIRENRDNTPSLPDTSDIGGSSDNAPRRRRRIMEGGNVASTNTTGNDLGNGSGDSVGDGDGNAACRRCQKRYPSWARSRGIQGSITVSVDADAQGNVIDVRLISGSGNDRLDEHHLKLARRWKLKRSSNGRQGVTIITRYQLQ
ncbi:hypothetical protein NIES267_07690 [Calothrix parasitica NIES-267]|uniref:TonB C-terminal domain-containing protein n=1 Tax=Calothrix parasitica NIES-267 TaxID=1973488 RepID=A0A1Z4LJ90_9CYAN|nr:hypothetical protein NIES267_07690 [Calothrix parasitica NIES-267]